MGETILRSVDGKKTHCRCNCSAIFKAMIVHAFDGCVRSPRRDCDKYIGMRHT